MHILLLLLLIAAGVPLQLHAQPIQIDTFVVVSELDTDNFWIQIPEGFDANQPPAIVVWWHGYGGTELDMLNNGVPPFVEARHWISATFKGAPVSPHWNTRPAQEHCRVMLDWIMQRYPFSMDSIYMVGASMGAAGGEIWHDNNCGISDYVAAAAAGGSPILDCELRQHQYLDAGHINNAMVAAFGGIPDTSAAVDFEYHRYSAIHFADTTQSMHFNSLHLPCYSTWGTSDGDYLSEWVAYGHPSEWWDSLRSAGGAETTRVFCSGLVGHGSQVMNYDSIFDWVSGFTANRFPSWISINADESDEYYWTRVTLADTVHAFGRYGAEYNWGERRLELNLVRNVSGIDVEFAFPWWDYDSLRGHWVNRDSAAVPEVTVRFTRLPTAVTEVRRNGSALPFTYADGVMTLTMPPSGDYLVLFNPLRAETEPAGVPRRLQISSAYPNPFNSQLMLDISSNIVSHQVVRLYDVTGRLARSLAVDLNPGTRHISLTGDGLASGIYFVTLSGSPQRPLKVMLLK